MNGANGSNKGHQGHVTIEGTVQSRSERGIKVDGRWLSLSRFKPVDLPEVGTHVRAEIDNRDFLCMLEVLESAPSDQTPAVLSDRDERITRLAVLKAAANFVGLWGQTREEVKSEHVLLLADRWLAWINEAD